MYRYNIREPDWISADNLAFFVCSFRPVVVRTSSLKVEDTGSIHGSTR